MTPDLHYLDPILDAMAAHWPDNRTINIVCHGHSVPAGYFATPFIDTFHAYPHLLHRMIKERFPFAVVNVIVTAIGGECAIEGAARFEADVLNHKPDLVVIDYGLNDRRNGLEPAEKAWEFMIKSALAQNCKVILCTPTWDNTYYSKNDDWEKLLLHTEQIRKLAEKYQVGLADSFSAYERRISEPADLPQYLSHGNHPTEAGHHLVAQEIAKYFIAR